MCEKKRSLLTSRLLHSSSARGDKGNPDAARARRVRTGEISCHLTPRQGARRPSCVGIRLLHVFREQGNPVCSLGLIEGFLFIHFPPASPPIPHRNVTNLQQNWRFKLIPTVSVEGHSDFHKLPSNTTPRRLKAFAYDVKLRVRAVHLLPLQEKQKQRDSDGGSEHLTVLWDRRAVNYRMSSYEPNKSRLSP